MRHWRSLLLLGSAFLLMAAPAHAAAARATHAARSTAASSAVVSAFDNAALGAATLTPLSDATGAPAGVQVDNIGDSGDDGVSVSLQGLSGCMFRMQSRPERLSVADVGAELHYKLFSLTGAPGAVGEALVKFDYKMRASESSLTCSCPSRFGPQQTVTVWRLGQPVVTLSLPPGSAVALSGASAANPSFVPDVGGSYRIRDRKGWDGTIKGLVCATASLHGDRSVTVGGQTVTGDEVSFEMEEPLDAASTNPLYENGGTAANPLYGQLRIVSPPNSSYSSIVVGSEECDLHDHWVSGEGASHLVCADGTCTLQGTDATHPPSIVVLPHHGRLLDATDCPIAIGDPGVNGIDMPFPPYGMVLDPVADEGASLVTEMHGSGGCTASDLLASSRCTMHAGQLELVPDFSGVCSPADSFVVLEQGQVKGTVKWFNDAKGFGRVLVQPAPGGPPAMMLSSAGRGRGGWDIKTNTKAPQQNPPTRGRPNVLPATSSSLTDGCMMVRYAFASPRLFVFGNDVVEGDEILFRSSIGGITGGAVAGIVVARATVSFTPGSSSAAHQSFTFATPQTSGGDQVFAAPTAAHAITASSCGSNVPVVLSRSSSAGSSTPVGGFSVSVRLSSNLVLSSSVVEGDFLNQGGARGTQMFVTDNGGGSYTVDCARLDATCDTKGDGTLFELPLCAAAGASNGFGTVSIDAVTFRDCSNHPIATQPGSDAIIPIQLSSPPAPSTLTATQVKSGNAPGSTTAIDLHWSGVSSTSGIQVYSAPFGGYPLYDKSPVPGHTPTAPTATPPPAPWTAAREASAPSVSEIVVTKSLDHARAFPPSRDQLYFVITARDAYGNSSAPSPMTGGTLTYHLGDVSDGFISCSGDDHVDLADVSLLGSHYGTRVLAGSTYACADVGPTTDFSVDARPTVDGKLSFEDLMVFSMNFSVVSAPQSIVRRTPATPAALDAVRLGAVTLPAVGQTFELPVLCDAAGDLQALSVKLDYDHTVLEQVGVTSGELLDRQDRTALALSAEPGDVDAALLGDGNGLAGSGELARITFRVKATGDARLAVASVDARDRSNHPVPVTLGAAADALPARTALSLAFPNPFAGETRVRLSLHTAGPVALGVYDIAGRHVRTLLRGTQAAGTLSIGWDGRDDNGMRQAAGVYLVRMEAAGARESRLVRLIP
jgi:hypothetical protein